MPGNGKVFISHAPEDTPRGAALLAALDAWEVDYWFDDGGSSAGQTPQLAQPTRTAIEGRDIFLRICPPATQRSLAMSLEADAFRGMQAMEQRRGQKNRRVLINIILDPGYVREPFDNATLFIDTTTKLRPEWMGELGRALGVPTTAGRVSRRTVLALVTAAALDLSSGTVASVLAVTRPPQNKTNVAISKLSGQALWHTKIGMLLGAAATPGSGVVYACSDQGTYALSASTGNVIWNVDTAKNGSGLTAPVLDGHALYVLDDENGLFALQTDHGSKLWNVDFAFFPDTTPTLANGVLYVTSIEGNVHAFARKDGSERWSTPIGNVREDSSDPISAPAFGDGTLYVGSFDHHLYALDAATGSVKWKFLTRGKIGSSPLAMHGAVYFGSADGFVYALDAHTGAQRWQFQTGSDVLSSPILVNGAVYSGSRDKHLYPLDAKTGSAHWAGSPAM